MSIEVGGQIFYKTTEACEKAGISRATLFRWLKTGILEKYHTDRRGWRLFTEDDLDRITGEARRIKVEYTFPGGEND